jgi:hypothetical protein
MKTEWTRTPSDTESRIEVGRTPLDEVAIRYTVNPGTRITVPAVAWDQFVQAVKNGHFDK